MVAVSLIPLGASKFLGITFQDEPISGRNVALAAATLLTMVAVNVFGGRKLRLYGVLLGMAVGYGLSLASGAFGAEQLGQLARSPWVAVPWIEGMTEIPFTGRCCRPSSSSRSPAPSSRWAT